jgi:hypothetical protein
MFFPDLSVYEHLSVNPCEELPFPYNSSQQSVLNVGWLDKETSFPQGQVSSGTLETILKLCFWPANVFRGCHFCNLCHYDEPPLIEWLGKKMRLGGAEIWVPGKSQIVYAAPNLIYHYILAHSYLPPGEFISAVDEFAGSGELAH